MTCRDCIHYDVCQALEDNGQASKIRPVQCGCFKDKSRFIELPCKVGDTVWELTKNYFGNFEIEKGKISMLQQKADKSWKFRITINSSVHDFTLDLIGKIVFLTKEEAETKLKELQNEK